MSEAGHITERYRATARAAGGFVLAVGTCALVGWIAGVDVLKSIVPGQVTMKVNTAICFIAAGGALYVLSANQPRPWPVRAVRWAGTGVALLAAAVFSQYVTGRDLGIDQLLFHEHVGAIGTLNANRMAPNTALAFVFSGAALALPDRRIGRRLLLAPILAGIVTALALLALLGYVSGVTSFYGVRGVTQMAVPTTLGFMALGLGLFLARPDQAPVQLIGRDTPGGAMLRWLLPAVVLVPLTLGGLRGAGQEAGLYDTQVGTWLFVVAIISLALPLIWRMAHSVDKAEAHRRHAEALFESEARTRKIVETAHDAFISIDADGRIAAWNPAAEQLFGWTAEEAIGREVAMVVPARLWPQHANALERAIAAPFTGETVRLHRDGHEIPVEIAVAASREDGGWVFNGFLRDISERLHAHEELRAAQHEVLQRLAVAAEYRDDDTGQHTRRVGDLSARLAASLGLPDDEVELIRRAAPLHDVGKIGIPDAILLKPGRLTPAEFEQVKTHALIGAEMLAGRGFPLLETAERIARSHHERWDGTGYPYGLAGPEIPLVGRIVALADVFDALTHDRPYKSAWSIEDAVAEINAQRGHQFDPELVDTFLALCPTSRRTRTPGHVTA